MSTPRPLKELGLLFFKLGCTAYGGPAAHIAMMEEEVVSKRKWISREHFLDLIGATSLIPGPNSTEMALHVGYERGRFLGMLLAGVLFIAPAALMTSALAWCYLEYASVPQFEPLLAGIKPAVLALILGAAWKLGRTAVKSKELGFLGIAVAALLLMGVGEVFSLFLGGVVGMCWLRFRSMRELSSILLGAANVLHSLFGASLVAFAASSAAQAVSLAKLALFFLKVGAVLFGSGYVLVAFLEGELVKDLGWLTEQQLLDAIAIGQFTPGPVLTTATFIGYILAGGKGAVVATVAIFLPSFVFVLLCNPLISKLRQSEAAAAFLDSVNVSSVALMLVVTLRLSVSSLTTLPHVTIALISFALLYKYKVNSAWLVLGGAAAGYLFG